MEWLTCIRTAIDYMEDHLTENISAQDVARQVYLSPFFLQRGFSLMTGYGIGEYIRNRRLYQSALDLRDTGERIIDIALKYGYETPESFTTLTWCYAQPGAQRRRLPCLSSSESRCICTWRKSDGV